MNTEQAGLLTNYKKACGALARAQKKLEDGGYCVEIMQQNLAVIGLLKSINAQLLEEHLRSCFKSVMESGSEKKKQAMIREILTVTKLNGK